ncbi:hypothetical protein ACK1LH_18675 [Metabacillus indicus]|nr:hypothetical protein [Metabacillus sp. cB07]
MSGARKADPSPGKVAALERVAPEKRIHHLEKWQHSSERRQKRGVIA